ncbi:hypothetical protein NDA03_21165 [Trichocoleus sp. Lan]|uniref:hypothetical protein n=1 Tax=unclassified Trichocoleus TaxID=2628910 RepID=UPI003299F8F7
MDTITAIAHKHYLSRGGSLQGAIARLQHKGLIYGSEQGYLVHHASGSTTRITGAIAPHKSLVLKSIR